MIRNYYYLIVGILSILFSFTHAWNGQANFLPVFDFSENDTGTQTILFYVWHIITAENLIFGITFLIMAFYKDLSKVKFAAWMIVSIMIGRWLVIIGSTLIRDSTNNGDILTDSIAMGLFTGLIILGIKQTNGLNG